MQQVQQQREVPERMSWARALIFAAGFFFISAILIGQLPGYVFLQLTASSLEGLERGSLALAVTCLAGFVIIQVILLLFDPKPLVPPNIISTLGVGLSLVGLAVAVLVTVTGCAPDRPDCNQYFPTADVSWNPVLGGKVLWFQPNAVDFVMLGIGILAVGLAMVFYGQLAAREQRNPDRRDPGTTPGIRLMIIASIFLLIVFMVLYTLFDQEGLALALSPDRPFFGKKLLGLISSLILGTAIFMTLGAFALRLHYLMRPVRKRTMSILYPISTFGFALIGVIFLLIWVVAYPLVYWIHTWSFIGLNSYLTVCSRPTDIPGSCSFSEQAGYLVDAIITTGFFALLMAAIWAWKSKRNLVIIGSVVVVAVIAGATLMVHTSADKLLISMMLCAAMLILAVIWTSVARREFAVVGENNLGCLGQWLIMGTCLFVYLAAFAFFSFPQFPPETEANIPLVPGVIIAGPHHGAATPTLPATDALVMLLLMGILAAIQFYFLTRNRYKV
jgi:hypothetical protein